MQKTIIAAKWIDGFWDRWIVHGVEKDDISSIRSFLVDKESWVETWGALARSWAERAVSLPAAEAETAWRKASLYYHLAQWIIPERNEEKKEWLLKSLQAARIADELSPLETHYVQLDVEGKTCFGRVRLPVKAKGAVIIINPLDSTKEELFTYEDDFLQNGFVTVSFDGPGQGETYVHSGLKGAAGRWEQFIHLLIDWTSSHFSLPICVFGTSSGASWAIYSSGHPKVRKVAAVSPAFESKEIQLPAYFVERVQFVSEEKGSVWLPQLERTTFRHPVLLVHGKRDTMVPSEHIYRLYDRLPVGKQLLEFDDEGHCCNYKLHYIRGYAASWFQE
ncbi:hypothetical protein T260_11735 [Geobacillus thermopakistaniensis]|uniref:Alpha/beta hydrolase n=3 Tax=Geobacillus TaxID=129337 RepID=A0A7U9P5Q1_GEOTM|nr:hypothetical protein T260_11735 [Geobacillus sp. MAS1]